MGRASFIGMPLWWHRPGAIHFWLVGIRALSSVAWSADSAGGLIVLRISSGVVWWSGGLRLSQRTLCLLSFRLCFFIVLNRICLFTVMVRWRVGGYHANRTTYCFVPLQKIRA